MDKKSVVVVKYDDESVTFQGSGEVSYDYQIGEHNGCLLVVEKRSVDSVISVPDTEEIVMAYSSNAWDRVYQE